MFRPRPTRHRLFLPDGQRGDVIELDMTVDEALKYIVSMGVVPPPRKPRAHPTAVPALDN
jgi:uncharacterized membrane protein